MTLGSATAKATAVTYGGEAMAAVSGGEATQAGSEATNAQLWFLSTPPTGSVTITVTRTNDATPVYGSVVIAEAATSTETEVYTAGIVLVQASTPAAVTEQSVDDGSPGTNSLRLACGASGADSPDDAGANSTATNASIDIGAMSAKTVFESAVGQGSRSIGFGDATTASRAIVHFAIRQAASGSTACKNLLTLGVGAACN